MRIKIEIVRAVARAMYRCEDGDAIQFERLAPVTQDRYLKMAKAAIEALDHARTAVR